MNKKATILVLVIMAVAALLMLWGRGGSGSKNIANIVSVGTTEAAFGDTIPQFDFGNVSMATGKVAHDFVLANNTGSDIMISQAETSCMCTEAVIRRQDGSELGPFGMAGMGFAPSISETVKPGEKLAVRVIFDPAAHGPAGVGTIERQIVLGLKDGKQVIMNFKAQVTP